MVDYLVWLVESNYRETSESEESKDYLRLRGRKENQPQSS